MKRILIWSFIMCSVLLVACEARSIGIIGGADGSTSIYVSGNGEKEKDHIEHNSFNTYKWGITLQTENVTPKGLTLKIEQFGGNPSGELQTGAAYFLETTVNDEWQEVKTKTGQPLVWNAIAYMIKKNDITEMNIDWQYAYGELNPGFYRLKKEIMDFRAPGDFDTKTYEVYFTIE